MIEKLNKAQRENAIVCTREFVSEILSQFTGENYDICDRDLLEDVGGTKAFKLLKDIVEFIENAEAN